MALNQDEIQALSSFNLDLAPLLTEREQQALQERIANLLQINRFPLPPTDWPAIPWPPF
jgi:hypothetical protein